MQNSVIHIVKELEGAEQLDSRFSFDGFIHFLKRRREEDRTMRVKFLDFVIQHFEERLQGRHVIPVEEVANMAICWNWCIPYAFRRWPMSGIRPGRWVCL